MNYIDNINKEIFPFVQYDGYSDRYPTLTAQTFDKEFYDEIRYASKELFKVFCKVANVFQNTPDKFMEIMDMPKEIIPFLNIPNKFNLPTWFSRFDFVLDKGNNLHMVELNADTPCFVVESFYANGVASDFFKKKNPNKNSMFELQKFLDRVYSNCQHFNVDLVSKKFEENVFCFACFADYEEDLATTKFLMNQLKSLHKYDDIRFLDFYDMKIDDKGILLNDGKHASFLYRLHPMELLVDETCENGEPLGQMFLDLYQNNKFTLMNPPEALILQNKSFMSLVWSLYKSAKYFSDHEKQIIAKYLTPSFFEDEFDDLSNGKYIYKEIWGREGKNVCVVEKNTQSYNIVQEKLIDNYEDVVCRPSNKAMYQKFVEQKRFSHKVDSGTKDGFLTLSCFMLFDQPSAIGCRFSPEEIAGTEAYWLPLLEN